MKLENHSQILLGKTINLDVDGRPWKENLFAQSVLLMNTIYTAFP